MIKSLYIKNFTIIDETEVLFNRGLNILTGETGAGKSILIDAIDTAFGARASKELIKTGAQKATIELTIELSPSFPLSVLEENGIELEDCTLIISREISQSGTKSRINGTLVNQTFVHNIREYLIDIHSQHETYTYIQPKTHIHLLDSYGDSVHQKAISDYRDSYSQYNKIQKQLNTLQSQSTNNEQRVDFLKYQIAEIESAKLDNDNEYEILMDERGILLNSEELKELTYVGYDTLYGQDSSIIDALNSIETKLLRAADYDKSLAEVAEIISTSSINLREASDILRNYSDGLETDPQRLEEVEDRIDLLDKLKKKYGPTIEDAKNNLQKFEEELSSIDCSDEKMSLLKKQCTELKETTLHLAKNLTNSRKSLAETLSEQIQNELIKLEMPRVKFSISVEKVEELLPNGKDNVEFLISANQGEPLRPLAKIASGGEISRVMLAIKSIFAKSDKVNTVIFDEIDTGISGRTSQSVGEALANLAASHQILCITHQPIIAAMADQYFYIEKVQTEDATTISVKNLNTEEKVLAVSRLASGSADDTESVQFAQRLVDQAEKLKLQRV